METLEDLKAEPQLIDAHLTRSAESRNFELLEKSLVFLCGVRAQDLEASLKF